MDKGYIKNLLNKIDPLVLEIGAHIGTDTIEFLEEFDQITLYCFEPDPRNIEYHKNNIKDNRCTLIEKAISNKNGVTKMYLSSSPDRKIQTRFGELETLTHSSSIKIPKRHKKQFPWIKFKNEAIVKTIRLDTWTQQNNIDYIDFIWADVQGAEKELIEGGKESLEKTKYFYTEYYDEEMYEGQLDLNKLKRKLPDYWDIVFFKNNNVLLENTRV